MYNLGYGSYGSKSAELSVERDLSGRLRIWKKRRTKGKFDAFYNAIKSSSANLADYADVDSVTKIYLINELGKNWDSGDVYKRQVHILSN